MAPAAVEGTGTVEVQYGLVPSTGEQRKDTSLPYILHLAPGSGRQPFPRSPVSPCVIRPRLNGTSASRSRPSLSAPGMSAVHHSQSPLSRGVPVKNLIDNFWSEFHKKRVHINSYNGNSPQF